MRSGLGLGHGALRSDSFWTTMLCLLAHRDRVVLLPVLLQRRFAPPRPDLRCSVNRCASQSVASFDDMNLNSRFCSM
jgi:hypothetical protein